MPARTRARAMLPTAIPLPLALALLACASVVTVAGLAPAPAIINDVAGSPVLSNNDTTATYTCIDGAQIVGTNPIAYTAHSMEDNYVEDTWFGIHALEPDGYTWHSTLYDSIQEAKDACLQLNTDGGTCTGITNSQLNNFNGQWRLGSGQPTSKPMYRTYSYVPGDWPTPPSCNIQLQLTLSPVVVDETGTSVTATMALVFPAATDASLLPFTAQATLLAEDQQYKDDVSVSGACSKDADGNIVFSAVTTSNVASGSLSCSLTGVSDAFAEGSEALQWEIFANSVTQNGDAFTWQAGPAGVIQTLSVNANCAPATGSTTPGVDGVSTFTWYTHDQDGGNPATSTYACQTGHYVAEEGAILHGIHASRDYTCNVSTLRYPTYGSYDNTTDSSAPDLACQQPALPAAQVGSSCSFSNAENTQITCSCNGNTWQPNACLAGGTCFDSLALQYDGVTWGSAETTAIPLTSPADPNTTLDATTLVIHNMDSWEYSWTGTTLSITNGQDADLFNKGFHSTTTIHAIPGSYMEWTYRTTDWNYVNVGASTNTGFGLLNDRIAWGAYFAWGSLYADEFSDDTGGGTLQRTTHISSTLYTVENGVTHSVRFRLYVIADTTDPTKVRAEYQEYNEGSGAWVVKHTSVVSLDYGTPLYFKIAPHTAATTTTISNMLTHDAARALFQLNPLVCDPVVGFSITPTTPTIYEPSNSPTRTIQISLASTSVVGREDTFKIFFSGTGISSADFSVAGASGTACSTQSDASASWIQLHVTNGGPMTCVITAAEDFVSEGNETVSLALEIPAGYQLQTGQLDDASFTIADALACPTPGAFANSHAPATSFDASGASISTLTCADGYQVKEAEQLSLQTAQSYACDGLTGQYRQDSLAGDQIAVADISCAFVTTYHAQQADPGAAVTGFNPAHPANFNRLVAALAARQSNGTTITLQSAVDHDDAATASSTAKAAVPCDVALSANGHVLSDPYVATTYASRTGCGFYTQNSNLTAWDYVDVDCVAPAVQNDDDAATAWVTDSAAPSTLVCATGYQIDATAEIQASYSCDTNTGLFPFAETAPLCNLVQTYYVTDAQTAGLGYKASEPINFESAVARAADPAHALALATPALLWTKTTINHNTAAGNAWQRTPIPCGVTLGANGFANAALKYPRIHTYYDNRTDCAFYNSLVANSFAIATPAGQITYFPEDTCDTNFPEDPWGVWSTTNGTYASLTCHGDTAPAGGAAALTCNHQTGFWHPNPPAETSCASVRKHPLPLVPFPLPHPHPHPNPNPAPI